MNKVSKILVFGVAAFHVYVLILEMFLWTHPIGLETFSMSLEEAQVMKVLAMNQGLYNGFLAAGLFYSLYRGNVEYQVFFLGCVIAAGVYGGLTAKMSILYLQALPAIFTLSVVLLNRTKSG